MFLFSGNQDRKKFVQLTPLNERHTTDAFSLNVFRQQKHGSNGTLIVIWNCLEHPSHFEKKRQVRGEAVGTLIFLFYKTSHVATTLYLFIVHFFFGPYTIFSASEINSFRKSKLFKFHSTGEDLDL